MPFYGSIGFQNSNSPVMEHLGFFHDHNVLVILMVVFVVSIMLFDSFSVDFIDRFFSENQEVEFIWTSLPAFLILFLAFPSMKILYMMEEFLLPSLVVKVIGHQWYWSYEYSMLSGLNFDSFMSDSNVFRLLNVSNYLVLPCMTLIQFLISSDDVIHSWSVPSLGIKIDAVPGRINQVVSNINRVGLYVGQCSEICGVNHSFMPIVISGCTMDFFKKSFSELS